MGKNLLLNIQTFWCRGFKVSSLKLLSPVRDRWVGLLYEDNLNIMTQFLKKNHMIQKAYLNTLLDIVMITTLKHYV